MSFLLLTVLHFLLHFPPSLGGKRSLNLSRAWKPSGMRGFAFGMGVKWKEKWDGNTVLILMGWKDCPEEETMETLS